MGSGRWVMTAFQQHELDDGYQPLEEDELASPSDHGVSVDDEAQRAISISLLRGCKGG